MTLTVHSTTTLHLLASIFLIKHAVIKVQVLAVYFEAGAQKCRLAANIPFPWPTSANMWLTYAYAIFSKAVTESFVALKFLKVAFLNLLV